MHVVVLEAFGQTRTEPMVGAEPDDGHGLVLVARNVEQRQTRVTAGLHQRLQLLARCFARQAEDHESDVGGHGSEFVGG